MANKKQEEEFSKLLEEKIPIARDLAVKEENLEKALELLLSVEKKVRLGADAINTGKVLVAIVRLCFDVKNWKELNNQITILSKRRSQLKQAFTKMVQECVKIVEEITDKETRIPLIDAIRTVTEGKIHVEVERARVTQIMAGYKEADGNIEEAADLMLGLQVETFGSMEKREKADFILEQMRLTLLKKDFVRVQIISKKIASKVLESAGFEDIKLRFWRIMIQYYGHDDKYLDCAHAYHHVFETEKKLENISAADEALRNAIVFLVLSLYDNTQSDFMHRLLLLELPEAYRSLLKYFTSLELIPWKLLESKLKTELFSCDAFSSMEDGERRWSDLKARTIQHNIRVIEVYYSNIRLARLADLLELPVEDAEEHLCAEVQKSAVYARINRLEGVVSFRRKPNPSDTLDSWSNDVSSLLSLMEKTCHLIRRENMVYKVGLDSEHDH